MPVHVEPLISVIVPCFNRVHLLGTTLDSVLRQQGVRTEILVIDDGSTEDVAGVCSRHGDRIKYLRQENQGAGAARNRGLSASSGEFIYFLDSDDSIEPKTLHHLLQALQQHPEWAAAVCRARLATGDLKSIGIQLPVLPPTGNWFLALSQSCFLCTGTILCRRSAMPGDLRFDTTLKSGEDWDFWLQWARTGVVFGIVPDADFTYRCDWGGTSRRPLAVLEACKEVYTRARSPDPRVTHPAPRWRNGAPSGDLAERLAVLAAGCAGRAIAKGETVEAVACIEQLLQFLNGHLPSPSHYGALLTEVAVLQGQNSPFGTEVWNCCWQFLREFDNTAFRESPARKILPELARGLSGVTWMETERDLWKSNYRRLASFFPVKQLLVLRRFAKGTFKPAETV